MVATGIQTVGAAYALIALFGWALLPYWRGLFAAAHDGGAGAGRGLALLLVAYSAWLLAVGGLGHAAYWLAGAAALLAGGVAWWRQWDSMGAWLRQHWRGLLLVEGVGLVVFAAFVLLRGFTGDITTLEKFMNLGIINSVLLEPTTPPRNMWFAGFGLNYYYFGHWLLSVPLVLLPIHPLDTIVWASPLVASLSAQAATTVVLSTHTPTTTATGLAGHAAVPLVVVLLLATGDAHTVLHALANWHREWGATFYQSQIPPPLPDALAPVTGNLFEVPALAFIWGEIHAHVVGVVLLVLLVALVLQRTALRGRVSLAAWHLLAAVLCAAGFMTNAWQYPTMVLLALIAIIVAAQRSNTTWRTAAGSAALVVGGSMLAAVPFLLNFAPIRTLPTPDERLLRLPAPLAQFALSPIGTDMLPLLGTLGVLLVPVAVALATLLPRTGWRWLAGAAIVGAGLALLRPTSVLLLPLLVAAVWVGWHSPQRAATAGGWLVAVATLLLIVPDYLVIVDIRDDRANTLFKLYYQSWILLALALPMLLLAVYQHPAQRRGTVTAVLVVAVLLGGLYPVLRGRQWVRLHGDQWWGWQGTAQLAATYPAYDAALRWLWQQPNSDGIVEAPHPGGPEDPLISAAPFASLSGRPAPIGRIAADHVPMWHSAEVKPDVQRALDDAYGLTTRFAHEEQVNDLYAIFARYTPAYVLYGRTEQAIWGNRGRRVLAEHLPQLWQQGDVTIYGRPATAPPALAWLPPTEWGTREYSPEEDVPFRWLRGQRGRVVLHSKTAAVVAVRLQLLTAAAPGTIEVWHGTQYLATLAPTDPTPRLVWVQVPPGETTLEIVTNVPPQPDGDRTVSVAMALPTVARVVPVALTP